MSVTPSRMLLSCLLVGALASRLHAQEQPAQPKTKETAATGSIKAEADEAASPKAAPVRAPRPSDVQRVFAVEHVSARAMGQLLAVFPASISYSTYANTRALAVSASPAVMAAIEETLKRLDVPSPSANVELTGYVLEALAQPTEGARVPPALEGVVTQLKHTFNYAAYRLVDTLIARTREGSELVVSALAEASHGPGGARTSYSLRARRASVAAGDAGSIVRLDRLSFDAQVPVPVFSTAVAASTSWQYKNVGLSTDVDIREGQTVVVGKSGVGEAGNAIILVLSAKVVD